MTTPKRSFTLRASALWGVVTPLVVAPRVFALVAVPLPARAQGPDGLDGAALAALAEAPDYRGATARRRTGWAASSGGAAASVGFAPVSAVLTLGVPSLDLELGAVWPQWLGQHTQVYGGASAFVSPRRGVAAGARLSGGLRWQASWPSTLVRLGAAASLGAAGGVDQGIVPLVPGELSVEVLQAVRGRWLFVRATVGAETAASERWTLRGGLALGAVL